MTKSNKMLLLIISLFMTAMITLQPCYAADSKSLDSSEVGLQLSAIFETEPYIQTTISTNNGDIVKEEYSTAGCKHMLYCFPDSDLFYQQRSYSGGSLTFLIAGSAGTVRYYDPVLKDWNVHSLSAASETYNKMLHVIIDGKESIICPPFAWKQFANRSVKNIISESGTITISREANGFRITFRWPKPVISGYSDFFFLSSSNSLIDWTNKTLLNIWKGYQFSGENRWCYDGFYFISPSSYFPSGKDVFNLNPAAYTPSLFIKTGGSRAADELGIAMLDVMSGQYVSGGYIPSYAKSIILAKNYNINGGYFDDRFNTDIASAYSVGYQKFGIEKFRNICINYADFLYERSNINYYTVTDGTHTGKMLQDYWQPSGNKGTHCALNHQAAVILYLYKMGEPKYMAVADQLLMGIKITRDKWIKSDGDLNYAFLSNGRYGMKDYPYLTYNDLYLLQGYLRSYNREDPDIAKLMDSKRAWMDKNKITQYYGYTTK